MASRSAIEWTDATWSPIRARNKATGQIGWHCEHASEGCRNCYAEGFNKRLGTGLPFKPGHRDDIEIFLDEEMLLAPLRWKKPRIIFVCSMTDLFGDFVKDEWIDRIFAVMALCPHHTFQVLTKRSGRMREYVISCGRVLGRQSEIRHAMDALVAPVPVEARIRVSGAGEDWRPLPSVWLGVSVEDQANADSRIPDLLATPAAIRFVSYEPALGPVNFRRLRIAPNHHTMIDALRGYALEGSGRTRVDQIIVGGESGQRARPPHPDWFIDALDQCEATGVSFFFKQWGEWAPLEAYSGNINVKPIPTRLVALDGRSVSDDRLGPEDFPDSARYMYRVGKKRAGRLLDGAEHNAMPERAR